MRSYNTRRVQSDSNFTKLKFGKIKDLAAQESSCSSSCHHSPHDPMCKHLYTNSSGGEMHTHILTVGHSPFPGRRNPQLVAHFQGTPPSRERSKSKKREKEKFKKFTSLNDILQSDDSQRRSNEGSDFDDILKGSEDSRQSDRI